MIFTVEKIDLFFQGFYSGGGTSIVFWKLNIAPNFANPVKCFNLVIFVPVAHLVLVSSTTREKNYRHKSN